jgi:hypothetical protein
MCEDVHGIGKCERLNKFTYSRKCNPLYTRVDHTRCKKLCDPHLIKNIINFKCFNQKVEYVNNFESYKSEEQCLIKFSYCRNKVIETNRETVSVWVKECPPNTMKLGFMCIPYCMSEMSDEMIETLSNDPNYCVETYENLGLPFYDFF